MERLPNDRDLHVDPRLGATPAPMAAVDDALVERYIAGECTATETLDVEHWIAAHPDEGSAVLVLRQRVDASRAARPELRQQRVRARVLEHVRERLPKTIGLERQTQRPYLLSVSRGRLFPKFSWSGQTWGVALFGGVAVALLIGGAYASRIARSTFHASVYRTRAGETATVRLANGSTLLLGPATSVAITPRRVEVSGETYFTVPPHASRPFIVQTKNAIVRVLGTQFAVRQYPGETTSRVVVENGKVSLSLLGPQVSHPSQTALSARMLAVVTDSGIAVTAGIVTREYTGWTQGTLVFDHVPLHIVVTELSRAYGMDISVADSILADQKMIVEVAVSKSSVTQILDAISLVMDAHYVRSGRSFVLSQGRRNRSVPSGQKQRNRVSQPEQQYGR